MLMQVFNLVASKVPITKNNALSQFQEFLLVLMRMKLNLQFQDLGFRFGVSHSTATTVFYRWITLLSERLEFLIKWPEREELSRWQR